MTVIITKVEKTDGAIAVTLDSGAILNVIDKNDLLTQLRKVQQSESDFKTLKAMEGEVVIL